MSRTSLCSKNRASFPFAHLVLVSQGQRRSVTHNYSSFFDGENCIYNITKLIISFSQSVLKVFFNIFLFYCKATFSGAQSKARAGAAKFFLAIQQNTPLDLLQLQKTTKEKYTLITMC